MGLGAAKRRKPGRLRPGIPWFLALGVACLHAPDLAAQAGTTTGVIRGEVSDPLGNPVPGAVILIQHRDTDLVTTVETAGSGGFVRSLLPPGTYDLTVTAAGGFGTERIEGAILRVGEVLHFHLDLRLVAAETVTVFGELPSPIETTDFTRSQRLREEVVDAVPSNGRNFVDLALLTPGASISQGPDGDELNINGQRGIFNNFIVDGADFNNPFFGEQRGGQRAAFTFNQDAIGELVIVNQGAPAEFGRSAGGFINVITKSGTNELAGSAHYFGQWDEIAAEYTADRGGGKPDFGRNQFGATFGGPLVRDRAFFFLAYDQQAAAETKQTTRRVANPANVARLDSFLNTRWPGLFEDEFGPIRRTDDARSLLAKLDFNLSGRHQASLKYNYNLVRTGERHLRRGLVGRVHERDRAGLLPRGEREPPLPAHQCPFERTADPVGARGPAALVRRTAACPAPSTSGPAPVRPSRRPPVPGHRDGLRGRFPHRAPVLPAH